MSRVYLWAICTYIALFSFPAHALEKVVLQFHGSMSFGKSGYMMAIHQGFYAEEGLQVEMRPNEDQIQVTEHLLSGAAQFGTAPTDIFLDYLVGKPIVVLAAFHEHTGYGLYVRHDSNITTLQDLVGKTIVASSGSHNDEIKAMLTKAGVNLDSINFLSHKGDVQADRRADYLLHHRADAVMIRISPKNKAPFIDAKVPVRIFNPADYGIQFYQNISVTSQALIQQRPQLVAAFYRATQRGWRYAVTHPNETIDVFNQTIVPLYPNLAAPPDVMTNKAISHFERIGVHGIGVMYLQRWKDIAADYTLLGMTQSNRTIESFIYNPNPTPNYAWVQGVLVAGASAMIIAAIILLWNRQLKQRIAQRTESIQQSEHRQSLIMQELDHRVKNNLAAIISLSNQTLGASHSLTDFAQVFTGRLQAMAGTHEALARSQWTGVSLDQLIQITLRAQLRKNTQSYEIQGPPVTLPPITVTPISIAIHELATNATQYGALQLPQGKIQINWTLDENQNLILHWIESAGPTIAPPASLGLGLQLTQGLIQYECQGSTQINFNPQGLHLQIQIPLAKLAEAHTPQSLALASTLDNLAQKIPA